MHSVIKVGKRELKFNHIQYNKKTFLEQGLQTGHAVWPCARLLCDFMQENPEQFQGKVVLELGCGLGVCGSAAAIVGAREVIYTDNDTAVLDKAKDCAETNLGGIDVVTSFSTLRWDCSMRELDSFSNKKVVDVIIGSDLLYGPDPRANKDDNATVDSRVLDILRVSDHLLSNHPDASIYLAFERREHVSYDDFFKGAERAGFQCCVPIGEYYEDIFGNRTEEQTDFWRACVFEFKRRHSKITDSCSGEMIIGT